MRKRLRSTYVRLRTDVRKIPLKYRVMGIGVTIFVLFYGSCALMNTYLLDAYSDRESPAIYDRNGILMTLYPNDEGQYGRYSKTFPSHVTDLLVHKEDRFFYWHPGVNPVSMVRALFYRLIGGDVGGGSTITQQVVKDVLQNGQDRTIANKVVETFGAISLELFNSKQTIVTMYANSVYMGNQVQGLDAGSELYFGKPLAELDDTKLMMLLATISSPSVQNPWDTANQRASRNLAIRLHVAYDPSLAIVKDQHVYVPPHNFELAAMHATCAHTCVTTIDSKLTDTLRDMLNTRVQDAWDSGVRSGAIIVLKEPENEILATIGTPDVHGDAEGQQIDMALEPRPIGSTIKPFIYLDGYTKGLRPYTLVDDREYKFPIGDGASLYPKNYDGQYHGWITLHYALSNSLNVPSVKALQYIGLTAFYGFLEHTLSFRPMRDLDEYQYGIALGALDMDPLTLAHLLSLFPRKGILGPLKLYASGTSTPYIQTPMSYSAGDTRVADPAMTELVTKVLNDRLTGVEQFGLSSSLNLSESNYAVKTGTSENFHDSWTVGYTPDFLVVVWFGSPDNSALKHVSGQMGAGTIWHDTMETLIHSPYNKHTPLDTSKVVDLHIDGDTDFGLRGDVIADHQNLLPDNDFIRTPQDGDNFLFDTKTAIPLNASESVSWYVNDHYLGEGKSSTFYPQEAGEYTIKAVAMNGVHESISIHLTVGQ